MDFCNYLVRQGLLKASEVPALEVGFCTFQYVYCLAGFLKLQASSLQATTATPDDADFGARERGSFFNNNSASASGSAEEQLGVSGYPSLWESVINQDLLSKPFFCK